MKVIGLDQATNSGWTFGSTKLDLKDWQTGRFKAPKRDEEGERLIIIHDSVLELIDRFEPDMIAYEAPFDPTPTMINDLRAGREVRKQFDQKVMHFLQRVAGAVMMAAARRSIPTESYQPRSWMATLKLAYPTAELEAMWGQHPKAKADEARRKWRKAEIMRTVKRLGAKVETSDEADSFGICFHALHGKAGIKRATSDLFERAKASL